MKPSSVSVVIARLVTPLGRGGPMHRGLASRDDHDAASPDCSDSECAARCGTTTWVSLGPDALMIPPPSGVRSTPTTLNTYSREVDASTPLPCWAYNFPQENCASVQLVRVAALIEIPKVAATQQAPRDNRQLVTIMQLFGDQIVVFIHLLSRLGMTVLVGGLVGDDYCGSGMFKRSWVPQFSKRAWGGERVDSGKSADQFATLMRRLRDLGGEGYNPTHVGTQAPLTVTISWLAQRGGYPRRPKLPLTDPVSLAEIIGAVREARRNVVA